MNAQLRRDWNGFVDAVDPDDMKRFSVSGGGSRVHSGTPSTSTGELLVLTRDPFGCARTGP
jgi:hypothetical protein